MKIILVGDELLAERLGAALHLLGHSVAHACTAAEAIALFHHERADIIIADLQTAELDGLALARTVREIARPQWLPVLLICDYYDDELQRSALQAGCDACIVRSGMREAVPARLEVIARLLELQQQSQRQAHDIERHRQFEAEERRIARELVDRFVRIEPLGDPALRRWLRPAMAFGGDIVAALRTPSDILHVLLADGTGHGFAASVHVLPVLGPFYRMTEKGFGIEAIARELNARVREFLPSSHFVAATVGAIDFREGVIRLWNGGNPEPALVGPQGSRIFASSHVPLGVLPDAEFDDTLDVHAFADGSQLFLYSDGVIEVADGTGVGFGSGRLMQTLTESSCAERFDRLQAGVENCLAGRDPEDDISVLMVDCCLQQRPAQVPVSGVPSPVTSEEMRWRASLCLSATEIRHLDAVPVLLGLTGQFDGTRVSTDRLFLVLSELYNNAVDHGLLGLDSRLKCQADGMERYLAERQERLAALCRGEVELQLEQLAGPGGGWLRVSCRDSGPGFAHASRAAATGMVDSELPFGRGIMLLQVMCSSLTFNEAGNHVTALVPLEVVPQEGG